MEMLFTLAGLLLALLHLVAAFYSGPLNWGFHHLAFYGLWVKLAVPALMLLALVPRVQRRVIRFIEKTIQTVRQEKPSVRLALVLSALGATMLYFWIGRERVFLLGDGALLIRDIQAVHDPREIGAVFPSSPLVGFLAVSLEGFLRTQNPKESAQLAIQLLSILSGGTCLLVCAKLSQSLTERPLMRSLSFLFLMAGGTSQLFFGYVETYAPAYCALLVFVWTALSHTKGRMHLVYPSIAYGLLVMLHVGMLCLVPALVFLYIQRARERKYIDVGLSFLALVITVGVLLILCGYSWEDFRSLFAGEHVHLLAISRVTSPWQAYSMFSVWHFVDVANLFLLLSPFALVILPLTLLRAPESLLTGTERTIALVALCGFAFIWTMNSDLGMSRDWDLESTFAFGTILLALASFQSLIRSEETCSRLMVMMIAITLLHSVPWVILNESDGAIERYRTLQDGRLLARETLAYSYEDLGILYRERGQLDQALECFKRSVAFDSTNGRRWVLLADVFMNRKQTGEMVHAYEMAIRGRTTIPGVYLNTARYYATRGEADKAIDILQLGLRELPDERAIAYTLGFLLQFDKKDYRSALEYYRRTIQIDSLFAEGYLRAGECCRQLKMKSEMTSLWGKFLELSAPGPLSSEIRRQLDSLND